ncbi:helix-turn-helix domain-containing protein [Streptomyces sp. NPDC001889]
MDASNLEAGVPSYPARELGRRIAYYRSIARPKLTQQHLADRALIHVGTLRKIERGARGVGDAVLAAIAEALGVDPSVLTGRPERGDELVHAAMPALSAVLATVDMPDDGPVRSLAELTEAVGRTVLWRLGAQYALLSEKVPDLLAELARARAQATPGDRRPVARLLISTYRAADAVAYKHGATDLSARLIDQMRWIVPETEDSLTKAAVAYVRTETFFAARAHSAGLRALEQAIDASARPDTRPAAAARGALHMRAAVVAGRAQDADAADAHMRAATELAGTVPEGIYHGTAFGPDSVRIHQVSVAVGLGGEHAADALDVASEWKPGRDMPAERRSGFYIDLARAQLWTGRPDHAFESLRVARKVAPQHTRRHPWVREDAATLRRLKRADAEDLSAFALWCRAEG